ncbi:penicillin-binding protein 1B [Desulfobacter postgatei]|uniref:Penicillin-binding protein 1B n=1 Tax=Desulfobacter postgatei 2ac9 TaxID=879212 RepID=I5B0F9_9BACT|nr:penicillin-binding protein 1B [Desulfobacter postgatei]EIM62972.1 penicillin-binding protein 1B [Desulfobacter postgatei 2ac9]
MKLLRRLVLFLLLCACMAFFGYAYLINHQVAQRFKDRLWDVPAKVYARPMTLYPGLQLSVKSLEQELDLLGYRRVETQAQLTVPGTYTRYQGRFVLSCRSFDFGEQRRPVRRIELIISGDRIAQLKSGERIADMEQLDPVLIGQFYPSSMEDRILVDTEDIPALLKKTIIAVEDKNFYSHYGIDFKSIFRAIVVNIRQGRLTQGASTLTQQLAKNFFLSPDKTLKRKFSEAFVAAAIERQFTKEEILEAYINEVYLGQDGSRGIYGFGLGAQFYFGKSLELLSPKETALLVGMLKGPSVYNPRVHPDRAIARRNTVLGLMADQELISSAELTKSLGSSLSVIPMPRQWRFPFYLDFVKRRLLEEYREKDLKTMGLRIFTPLDPLVQLAAEKGVADFIAGRDSKLEAGVVVTASATNEIQALVGGKKPKYQGFNRALDAKRPIGSLVKPVVYLSALERPENYTLVTRINDGPVALKSGGRLWKPMNFDKKFHGELPLFQALVHSYNTSTVRLGMDLGLDTVFATMAQLGFKPNPPLVPAMLLGSFEMTPVQVAQVYHTLASGGFYTPARVINAVYTPEGETLQRYSLNIEQHLDPGAVFLVDKTLQAVVREGTGRSLSRWLSPDLGIAGKTGTTNDLRDTWFAGFSGNRLAVVWVGRDDNHSTGLTGASGALQVFGRIMAQIPNTPLVLTPPENIEWAVIDPQTGLRTDSNAPGALAVPFIQGSAPVLFNPLPNPGTQVIPKTPAYPRPGQQPVQKKKPRYLIDWLKDVF